MLSSPPTIVLGASLLGIPIAYILNTLKMKPNTHDMFTNFTDGDNTVMMLGFLSLGLMVLLTYLGFKLTKIRDKRPSSQIIDPLFFVFSICCFSSVVDLLIGLENDGVISGFVAFYLNDGEPYLRTAHGTCICYWDGTGHYIMYIYMLYSLFSGKSIRNCGLYWVGSIVHSLVVFLPGNVAGPYPVKASFLLNVPFVVVPIWSAVRFLQERPTAKNISAKRAEVRMETYQSIWTRPLDILICFYFIAATVVSFFRGFVALGCCKWYVEDYEPYLNDPVLYPKLQMFVYLFYFIPYYIMSIYGVIRQGCCWMNDWSIIHAGAAAQAQVAFIGSSIHHSTPIEYRLPQTYQAQCVFWVINLSLLIIPQFIAYKFMKRSSLFNQDKISMKNKAY
ncbi:transmembrane 6 superfamily member 1-like [Tubulanus polymorphus]|uniref:transmembrane 6 superfamily member 1-like n=1 Tax=Tubulanus polymorphus TaxID=672921 RepID=UPI003DA455B0